VASNQVGYRASDAACRASAVERRFLLLLLLLLLLPLLPATGADVH